MDYTNKPQNNKQPASNNFRLLATLYGKVDGTPLQEGEGFVVQSAVSEQQVDGGGWDNDNNSNQDDNKKNKKKKDDRRLDSLPDLPPEVEAALDDIDALVDSGSFQSFRKLHENEFAQAHAIDLGYGYTAQVHILKVVS